MTSPGRRGFLISLEGVDRCGKSTQAGLLCTALAARGEKVGYAGVPGGSLREPGGTPAGEAVRELLLHRRHDVGPWPEALLYAAARAQLVTDVIAPSLADGWVVVCDRFVDSSLAYQGHARGLGVDRVAELNRWATGGLLPDVTVLLEIDPSVASSRSSGAAPDRIEREGLEFQRRVAEGYAAIMAGDPRRFVVVDGSDAPERVAAEVERRVVERLEVPRVR